MLLLMWTFLVPRCHVSNRFLWGKCHCMYAHGRVEVIHHHRVTLVRPASSSSSSKRLKRWAAWPKLWQKASRNFVSRNVQLADRPALTQVMSLIPPSVTSFICLNYSFMFFFFYSGGSIESKLFFRDTAVITFTQSNIHTWKLHSAATVLCAATEHFHLSTRG